MDIEFVACHSSPRLPSISRFDGTGMASVEPMVVRGVRRQAVVSSGLPGRT